MTVDQMIEKWVHKNDVQLIRDVYANEMTLYEVLDDRNDYITELESVLSNLKDELWDVNNLMADIERLLKNSPISYEQKKH